VSGLLGAIQFLTRVPVRTATAVPHERTVPWFPIVGLLIGAALGGLAAGLGELVPMSVAAAVTIAAGLLLTGAFHEDGLADVADAFGGGWTRERRFEILADSRHGTYGVSALAASVVVRVVALAALAGPAVAFAGLVAAHVLGRTAAVGALATLPPAAESGLGADVASSMRRGGLVIAIVAGAAITVAAVGWWAAPMIVATGVGTAAVGWLAVRKIGGIAGDVLGAVEQVVECLVLVVATGLAARHQLWWS
jgi:adenosylcobinamide-GDP ribazoletransferase